MKFESIKLDEQEISAQQVAQTILDLTLKKIELCESIYMTDGENNHFSKEFSDAAYKERQALCLLSSECYSFLRKN